MVSAREHQEFFYEDADGSRVGIVLSLKDGSASREKFLEAYKLLLNAMEEWEDIQAYDTAVERAKGEKTYFFEEIDAEIERERNQETHGNEIGQDTPKPVPVAV